MLFLFMTHFYGNKVAQFISVTALLVLLIMSGRIGSNLRIRASYSSHETGDWTVTISLS